MSERKKNEKLLLLFVEVLQHLALRIHHTKKQTNANIIKNELVTVTFCIIPFLCSQEKLFRFCCCFAQVVSSLRKYDVVYIIANGNSKVDLLVTIH